MSTKDDVVHFHLGLKSDPIQYRYSFPWLFDLLDEMGISFLQLGSFFELYSAEDDYFHILREEAEKRSIRIKSCFTSHRELGGLMCGDPYLEKAARKNFERYIHATSLLGADYMGSSIGYIFRDRMETKERGIERALQHLKELSHLAWEKGLQALTIEPMSCTAEPPSTPEEIDRILGPLMEYHELHRAGTVPFYLCTDIAHGLADGGGNIRYSNLEMLKHCIGYTAELHLKNTDALFNSTFGFSQEEERRGIVNMEEIMTLIRNNGSLFPVEELVGYYETSGPKLGRDYSDRLLRDELAVSLRSLKEKIKTVINRSL